METKIQELDGKLVATLVGEMDTAAAVEAEKILKPLYQSNGKDVIIDCKNLEYIASSGLRILLGILKGAKATGSKVVLKDVNDDIKNVFKLTGFISIFDFEGA
ncbi:MAG: STAS domain-containing protein [Prevotella sp.]